MNSRLFQAVVGVGISLGTLSGGCLGRLTSRDAAPSPEGSESGTRPPVGSGTTRPEPSVDGTASTGQASATNGGDAGPSSGGGAPPEPGDGSTGGRANAPDTSTVTGSPSTNTGDPAVGHGGLGGAMADSQTTMTSADDGNPTIDPFCDTAWPTTKGNPGPPRCVDPEGECEDAGYPSPCFPLLEDGSCDPMLAQSPFCIDAEWECAPPLLRAEECRCWGPRLDGRVCGDDATLPEDE